MKMKHKHRIRKVMLFNLPQYQCGCGQYFTKEQYEKRGEEAKRMKTVTISEEAFDALWEMSVREGKTMKSIVEKSLALYFKASKRLLKAMESDD